MLTLYASATSASSRSIRDGAVEDAVWIDLLNPTARRRREVEPLLGIDIPTREEMAEIEVSSRLYSENDALYMTASLLVGGRRADAAERPVTFILAKGDARHRALCRAERLPHLRPAGAEGGRRICKNADGVFVALLEAIIDRTADILEKVGVEIDAISRNVFQSDAAKETIEQRLQGGAAAARPQRRPQFQGAREPGQHRPAGEFPQRRMRRHASRRCASAPTR